MYSNLYLIAKLIFLFFVWIFITLFALFIFKSKNAYSLLKKTEALCVEKRKEFIYNYLPLVSGLAKKNESLKFFLNLKKSNIKDFVVSIFPMFLQVWVFYQWARNSFGLRNKVLR